MKQKSVKKIKDKAWDYCSRYVRLRYSDRNGFVSCYTCSKPMFWKEAHAGHGFGGRGGSILFEEKIIRPQCSGCNIFKNGNYDVFHTKLVKEYGAKFLAQMLKQKNTLKQFTLKEITEIHNHYKQFYEKELIKKNFYER